VTTVLRGLDAVRGAVGQHLGRSEWITIDDERVQRFAAATGAPLDPGFVPPELLVSLSNLFLPEIVQVQEVSMGVNYGTDAVRFPTRVSVGARVRGAAELVSCDDITGGVQTVMRVTIETDGAEPGCTIESISRWMA
jgi:acyl dehydratase